MRSGAAGNELGPLAQVRLEVRIAYQGGRPEENSLQHCPRHTRGKRFQVPARVHVSALATARELPKIILSDSLRLCLLLRGTDLFERAALRWHGRYCREVVAVDLDEAQAVLACLAALRGPRADVAARALCGLLDPVQTRSVRAELDTLGREESRP